ncbi:MAG TPA: tetratricopeptide repeat protein [Polyangiaceae bacterium]|nr:tetratricopeptide repeat protein [Polyangiaceae bacterium]
MQRVRPWTIALILAATACQRSPRELARAPRDHAAAKAAESEPERARSLALSGSTGGARIDAEIRALITRARKQPQKAATWIELGRSYVDKARAASDPGYYLNADACAEVALGISPDDPLALDLRALVLLNNHEFTKAKALSESLIARRPDAAMAWGSLSDALLELGEQDAAERAANTMLDLKPNLPSYSRASYLRWLRGAESDARELARLAIDASDDPRRPEPRAWMLVQAALLFWHAGDWQGADAGFVRALEVVKDYPPALVGRGRVALADGNAGAAADFFQRAYDASPLTETAWLLGEARELEGRHAEAKSAFADAEREGRRADRRTLSLMFSTQARNIEEAVSLAERERQVRADIYTEDALAFALYRAGRMHEANEAIQRARRLGTPDAKLMFHDGLIRLGLGDSRSGKRLLSEALAQNAHFDERSAREARTLLGTGG